MATDSESKADLDPRRVRRVPATNSGIQSLAHSGADATPPPVDTRRVGTGRMGLNSGCRVAPRTSYTPRCRLC